MKSIFVYLQFILFIFCIQKTAANHLLGGEINYSFVSSSGNTQTYKVTLSFFADCSSNNVGNSAFAALVGANPLVRLYKGQNLVRSDFLDYDAIQSNIEITPVCPDEVNNTACSNINNPLPGIKKYVYSKNFMLTGTDSDWRFSFEGSLSSAPNGGSSSGRSNIIQNANVQGGSSIMVLEATLNNTIGTNSSTIFTSLPTPFFCINKPATYSLGAVDAENDALTFKLIPGKQLDTATLNIIDISYINPYTALNPLPTAPGNFNFNNTNGQLNFVPDLLRNCIVVNLVEEFRDGIRIGSSMREMAFIILDNCNNDAPLSPVTGITNATINIDSSDNLSLSVCEGQEANISFDINSTDPNGDNTTITYSNLQQGATIVVDNNGTDSPSVHFVWNVNDALPGNYIFYITYTDDGCPLVSTKTIAYTITIMPHPNNFTGGSIASCTNAGNGVAWAIPAPGQTLDYSYRWVDSNGATLRETNSTTGDTLWNIPPGNYKVYIRNAEGCGKNVTISVNEVPLPEIALPADTTVCAGLPIDINTATQPDVSYLWNTGETVCCITVTDAGLYTLKATNLCGDARDSMKLDYVKCNYCLFVPNAFTPNGDGHNDKFDVLETCLIEKYKLQIFNRWGELVFTTLSTSNGWDGIYNGSAADPGVYYYTIEAIPTDKSKGTVQLKGDITLIR